MKFRQKLKYVLSRCLSYCRQKKKLTCLLLCFTAAALILAGFSQHSKTGLFVKNETGGVVAVKSGEDADGRALSLEVAAEKEGVRIAEEVILSLSGSEEKPIAAKEETPKERLKKAVADAVKSLSAKEGESIRLPQTLKDGTRLTWRMQKNYRLLLLIFIPPLALYFVYRTEKEKAKKEEKNRRAQILRRLPGFNNQLLLLLGGGLIFHDALYKIAAGSLRKQEKDGMDELLIAVKRQSEESAGSVIKALSEASSKLKIRELTRMVNIISDNQYKGVDLTEKLAAESELLWDLRKKNAQESGRLAETKLTFPLALLLVVLVVITAAPAILEM